VAPRELPHQAGAGASQSPPHAGMLRWRPLRSRSSSERWAGETTWYYSYLPHRPVLLYVR
jgi:hypothetical protein